MRRLSGLQLDVLKLYRTLLRHSNHDVKLQETVKKEFRRRSDLLGYKDIKQIEHGLRYGYKQIQLIQQKGFKTAKVV